MSLYNEISEYLKVQAPWRGNFPYFQELYDNLCKDEENQDLKLKSYYDQIQKCDLIDSTLIQEY